MINCLFECCGFKSKDYLTLSQHIRRKHKLTSEEYYNIYLNKENEGICKCGNKINFLGLNKGYNKYCSSKCAASNNSTKEKRQNTNIEKYGVENVFQNEKVKEKIKETNIEKYGVKNVSQNKKIKEKIKEINIRKYGVDNPNKCEKIRKKIEDTNIEKYGVKTPSQNKKIRKKIEDTNIEKYGVKNPLQNKTIMNKLKNTNIEKYGVENVFQNEEIKEKIKETNIEKYGVKNPIQCDTIKEKIKNRELEKFIPLLNKQLYYLDLELLDEKYINSRFNHNWKCTRCGTEFIHEWNKIQQGYICINCFPRNTGHSKYEKEIIDFLRLFLLDSEIIENDRNILNGKELDIYIPDKNTAIEFDGLYWHSEKFDKGRNYHLDKTIECESKNIQLIHIFEDEWIYKQDIVKYKLKKILQFDDSIRIHARKCIIKEIDPKIKNKFLNKYHIQGEDKSSIKLGAFYDNELISIMTFSKGSIAKGSRPEDNIYELSRFCSNYNYHIPGIASKLLSYFKNNYNWKEIFSYADRRWSTGNLYYKIGFKLEYITEQNYWYVKGLNRVHRFNLRKKSNEPKDIPEWILRQNDGYYRIWDCGHYKFKLI